MIYDGPQTRVSPGASPRIPRNDTKTQQLAGVGGWVIVAVDELPGRGD